MFAKNKKKRHLKLKLQNSKINEVLMSNLYFCKPFYIYVKI